MFMLNTEAALLAAFRPKDRPLVEIAPELKVPIFVRNYLTWAHPAGGRAYLVFAVPNGLPTGIVFDVEPGTPGISHLCDWCHQPGQRSRVGLLTARVNSRKTVGIQACSDLGCQQGIQEEADRVGRSALPALAELVARMGRFAAESMQIDLFAGR